MKDKNCLTAKVEQAVLKLGEATLRQVLAIVGKNIPASQSAAAGRYKVGLRIRQKHLKPEYAKDLAYVVEQGKYYTVCDILCSLTKKGRIRRIRKGVYGPPLPKLYKAS